MSLSGFNYERSRKKKESVRYERFWVKGGKCTYECVYIFYIMIRG